MNKIEFNKNYSFPSDELGGTPLFYKNMQTGAMPLENIAVVSVLRIRTDYDHLYDICFSLANGENLTGIMRIVTTKDLLSRFLKP